MSSDGKTGLSRRSFLRVSATALAGGVLAACGGTPAPTQTPVKVVETKVVEKQVTQVVEKQVEKVVEKVVTATPVPATPTVARGVVTIKVGSHWGGATGEAFQKMIDDYNKNKGAQDKIKAEYVTNGNTPQMITSSRLAGQPIDVYNIGNAQAITFLSQDVIVTLPDDVGAFIKAEHSPGMVELATFEGKTLGYPSEFNCCAMFYRKSWFKEAGLEPPKTVEDVWQAAKVLTKTVGASKRFGYTFGWDTWHFGAHFFGNIERFGGDLFTWQGDTPVKATIKQPAVEASIDYFLQMVKDGSCNIKDISLDPSWQNGVAGMSEDAGWFPLIVVRDAGKKDIYEDMGYCLQPVPKGAKPFARTYGRVMAIDARSKHKNEAMQMLRFWTAAPDMPYIKHLVEWIGCAPTHVKYPFETIKWSKDMVDVWTKQVIPISFPNKFYKALSYTEINSKVVKVAQGILLGQNTKDDLWKLQPEIDKSFNTYDGPRIKK